MNGIKIVFVGNGKAGYDSSSRAHHESEGVNDKMSCVNVPALSNRQRMQYLS